MAAMKMMLVLLVCVGTAAAVVCKCRPMTLKSHRNRFKLHHLKDVANVTGMEVRTKISKTPCILNANYGFIGTNVWVNSGCHAKFRVCVTPGKSMRVYCGTHRNKLRICKIKTGGLEISSIVPERHMSRFPCIPNYSYGLDGATVYVINGCRALFRIGLKTDVEVA